MIGNAVARDVAGWRETETPLKTLHFTRAILTVLSGGFLDISPLPKRGKHTADKHERKSLDKRHSKNNDERRAKHAERDETNAERSAQIETLAEERALTSSLPYSFFLFFGEGGLWHSALEED